MSSAHSMKTRKCVQSQSFEHESSKIGGRDRKDRGQEREARKLMEREADQQNKNLSEELKQGLPRHSSGN